MTTETIVVAKAKLLELHEAVADMTADMAEYKAEVEKIKNLRRSQIRNAWGAGFRLAATGYDDEPIDAREALDEYMESLPENDKVAE